MYKKSWLFVTLTFIYYVFTLIIFLQFELDTLNEDHFRLMDDLKRQQALYNELKKMRGRGEELDLLQQVEQVC